MKNILYFICILFSANFLLADYEGPGQSSTVKEILNNAIDESYVTLSGYIVQKLDDEHYIFEDPTGKITVEIEEDDFPKETVTPKTLLEIEGEVETHYFQEPTIEVEKVRIVKETLMDKMLQ